MYKRYRCLKCNKKYSYWKNMHKHHEETGHDFTDDMFWSEVNKTRGKL